MSAALLISWVGSGLRLEKGFGATGPWRDYSAFAFPTEEVEKRRRELLLALKNREDDLAQIAFDLFYETLFTTHPYRFSILGSEESIRTLQREQLIDYYRVVLNPEKFSMSMTKG